MRSREPVRLLVLACHSTDPALFLKSLLQHIGNFLRDRLGSALNRGAAALFPLQVHPAADDESRRVVCDNQAENTQVFPRGFAPAGICCAGSKFAQSLGCHLEALSHHL